MDYLKQQINQTTDEMRKLLDQADKIRGVIELIEEISDQINLLSLNAALEAAGAGEAGKRFNTVAEEIKRLAETTIESTEQVAALINQVIEAANKVAEYSVSGKDATDQAVGKMEDVGVFLVDLFGQVEKVTSQVQGITGSTEQQRKASLSLTDKLHGIEEAAMAVESSIMEVNISINELDRVAGELAFQAEADASGQDKAVMAENNSPEEES